MDERVPYSPEERVFGLSAEAFMRALRYLQIATVVFASAFLIWMAHNDRVTNQDIADMRTVVDPMLAKDYPSFDLITTSYLNTGDGHGVGYILRDRETPGFYLHVLYVKTDGANAAVLGPLAQPESGWSRDDILFGTPVAGSAPAPCTTASRSLMCALVQDEGEGTWLVSRPAVTDLGDGDFAVTFRLARRSSGRLIPSTTVAYRLDGSTGNWVRTSPQAPH